MTVRPGSSGIGDDETLDDPAPARLLAHGGGGQRGAADVHVPDVLDVVALAGAVDDEGVVIVPAVAVAADAPVGANVRGNDGRVRLRREQRTAPHGGDDEEASGQKAQTP